MFGQSTEKCATAMSSVVKSSLKDAKDYAEYAETENEKRKQRGESFYFHFKCFSCAGHWGTVTGLWGRYFSLFFFLAFIASVFLTRNRNPSFIHF